MKLKIIIATFITLMIIGISCQHKETGIKVHDHNLVIADSCMTTHPEISLRILDSLNNAPINKDHYFALLYAQAKYRNYIFAENDSLVKTALDYYSNCNDSIMKARAYLVASQVYRELGKKETTLSYIHKASLAARGTNDYWTKSFILYEWGRILRDAGDFETSTSKLITSLEYAKRTNDTIQIISRLRELSYNYGETSNYVQAFVEIDSGIILANKIKSYNDLAMLYGRKSSIYTKAKNYYEALRQIDKAIIYDRYADKADSLSNFNFKGRLLVLTNQLDSAEYYIEKGRDTSTMISTKLYYECMYMLREAQGDYKGAAEYAKSYAQSLTNIIIFLRNDKIAQLNKQYNTERIERENRELKISRQKSQIFIMGIIIAVVMLAFAAYVMLSRRRKLMQDTLQQQSESLNRLQQKESELIKKQICASEREMELAEKISNKNMELEAAKALIADLKKRQLLSNSVVIKMQKRISDLKSTSLIAPQPLSQNETKELIDAVNDCYDGFTAKLKNAYPALNDNDVLLCCLIKIGLDNPALCAMLNVSDNTLRKRKHRLKTEKLTTDGNNQYPTIEAAIDAINTTKRHSAPAEEPK